MKPFITRGSSAEEALQIVQGGKTEFQIVCAGNASRTVSRAAQRLAAWFAAGGVTIPVIRDGGDTDGEVPTDTYEILIGSTNRAESKAVTASDLPERGWLCRAFGKRLVIQATDDRLLEIAVSSLFGKYQDALDAGTITFEKGFFLRADHSGERDGWLLHGIPVYSGGTLSEALYDCGYGLFDDLEHPEDNSVMQIVSGTNVQEYEAYGKLLEENGCRRVFENAIGENRYAAYRMCNLRLYVYYTAAETATRIVWDRSSTVDPDAFSYSCATAPDAETVFYAYALWQCNDGMDDNNCGQLEVIKLADNSLFVIDGGQKLQFDQTARDGFVDFAKKITNTPKSEKVRIACWFLTHHHSDHREGLATVLTSPAYASGFALERMAFNYMNAQITGSDSGIKAMFGSLKTLYPECQMLKLHTGMKLAIAGMQMEVLYSHEDAVRVTTGAPRTAEWWAHNDASTVLKLTSNGVSVLILGDAWQVSERFLLQNIPEEILRADAVQVSHHTWNWLPRLYDVVQAKYAVFTQSEGGCHRTLGIPAVWVLKKVQQYAKPENCWFSGETTYGLLLRDGNVTVKETFPLAFNRFDTPVGCDYQGWTEEQMKDVPDYSVQKPDGWSD